MSRILRYETGSTVPFILTTDISHSAAFAFHAVLVGVSGEILSLAATLVPAALIGILLGRKSGGWISERGFRRLISTVLFATSISLLVVSFKSLFGNA